MSDVPSEWRAHLQFLWDLSVFFTVVRKDLHDHRIFYEITRVIKTSDVAYPDGHIEHRKAFDVEMFHPVKHRRPMSLTAFLCKMAGFKFHRSRTFMATEYPTLMVVPIVNTAEDIDRYYSVEKTLDLASALVFKISYARAVELGRLNNAGFKRAATKAQEFFKVPTYRMK